MTANHDEDPMTVLSGLMSDWFDGGTGDDMMRSFTDVNKRGLEAAAQLVSRMTDLVDGATGHAANFTAQRGSGEWPSADSISDFRGEVMKSIDMWADMISTLVDSSLEMMGDRDPSTPTTSLIFGPMRPGERTSRPLYAHSTLGQGVVHCRVGHFESASGECLADGSVVVEPDVIIEGAEAQTTVIVDLSENAVPDHYHGFVFADGVGAAAFPVEIQIISQS